MAALWLVDDVVHRVCLFHAPIWYSSRGGGTREAWDTFVENLVGSSSMRYRASKHQIQRGLKVSRSSTSQGSAEPSSCVRTKGVTNREVSEGKADL